MKVTGLLLIALFGSLSRANVEDMSVCEIAMDKYDRAAMYSRNFMVGQSTRWPDNTVPYKISSDFTASDVEKIKEAMSILEGSSCIKFVPYSDEKNYLNIFTGGGGCFASLGFNQWRTEARLHLQQNSYCMVVGTISHEMLHALGFAHEHTRPDRDQYLKIHWSKISSSVHNWFRAGGENESPLPPVCDSNDATQDYDKCYAGFLTATFGVGYDYGSVMHYHPNAGSSDGSVVMEVLKSIPSGVTIGQRNRPSVLDFTKLNKAYPCDKEVTTPKPVTTTTTEKPCGDYYSNCKDLVAYCALDQGVKEGCKKSCGICDGIVPTVPACMNLYSNCDSLKQWCNYSSQIRDGCPISCGLC